MIKKFEKHLTTLFFLTTSVILTLVLILVFFYQIKLDFSRKQELFQSQLLDLTHQLEGTSSFSDEWLSNLEYNGHLIIHIEDQGTPLFYRGIWTPKTERSKLITLAKEKALQEGIDTDIKHYSRSLSQSSIFKVKGEHHDIYLGTVLVLSLENRFRSLVLLADMSPTYQSIFFQFIFFLVLEILGILCLYLVSRSLVKRAIKPIEIYQKKQNEFIASASHELRSPLAVIQTSAATIKTMPEQTENMADLIERECIRSGNLIKNLLLLSKPDESVLAPSSLEEVELDAVLLQLLENYEILCHTKGIRLALKLPNEFLPTIKGNATWIYQILSIFLDNAIAYGCTDADPSLITMEAYADTRNVSVSISDHGMGIPDHVKPHIFDRFYKADASRNDKEHAGLGLSIAKMLAERMGLEIKVKDTPGGGVTFELEFDVYA